MGLRSDQLQVSLKVDEERVERAREKQRRGQKLTYMDRWCLGLKDEQVEDDIFSGAA